MYGRNGRAIGHRDSLLMGRVQLNLFCCIGHWFWYNGHKRARQVGGLSTGDKQGGCARFELARFLPCRFRAKSSDRLALLGGACQIEKYYGLGVLTASGFLWYTGGFRFGF